MPRVARGRGDEDPARAAAAAQSGLVERSIFANGLPSRTTTPGTPPSRTMRLEPRPSAITGTSGSSSRRKCDEILLVRRLEQPFGVAAALEPDQRRQRRVGGQPARAPRAWSRRALIARPFAVADAVGERGRPFGDVAGAHADDHVAVGGEVAQLAAELVEIVDGRAPCGGRARASPSTSAAESTPSIGSSPAG